MMPTLKVSADDHGTRLDIVLARAYPQYSRAFLQKLVRHGAVTRQGRPAHPSDRVHSGEVFDIIDFESDVSALGLHQAEQVIARKRPLPALEAGIIPTILWEDEALLALDKPAGLVVHPAPGHRGPTLIDWLRGHLGAPVTKIFTDPERLGLVHRLDKDTSGVLLIAKSVRAQTAVARQFRDRSVRKVYSAFIEGVPSARKGLISAPVGRSRRQPGRMAVSSLGRPSETAFEVNEAMKEVAQVTLFPKTGRTHQIRVHLAAIGHPIIGDRTYGSNPAWSEGFGIRRSLLHAQRLELEHPLTHRPAVFEAPWPEDFRRAQAAFRKAFAVLLVGLAVAGLGAPARAEEGTAAPRKKPAHHAATTGPSTSTAYRALKKDVAGLHDDLDALKAEVQALETAFAQLNLAKRLQDLEHAVPEINAKAAAGGANADEAKTQIMDANRQLKGLQDQVEQMRDQLDRLQREVIQRRVQQEQAPAAPSAPAANTGTR